MATKNARAFIRNIAEVPWREFPGHYGGALSKPLVDLETSDSRLIDYRISSYQPMAHVATHVHAVQEQVYHVLEGEGLMELDGETQVVRRHDVIFIFHTSLEPLAELGRFLWISVEERATHERRP